MLTSETKRHIDAARQVLVGKVPNPIGQVQEITNALIYKFMDDMDERAASVGGKRRYFTGEYEKYGWRKLMNPKVGSHERLGLYTEALSRLSQNKDLPELFRGIFRNAYLPFNDGRTLSLFLNEINYFDYKHSEELGNAYEYLLSIMGSQGDAGQFRTPRHIIDFIVAAVNPGKDDTVLDPACGTAGFLISAYKHVVSRHDGKDDTTGDYTSAEKLLTSDEKKKLYSNYYGFDVSDEMAKLSQVNMFLHGFTDPKIIVHDTLGSEDYWQDRYDVILANPPFMSPKGGVMPHNKFGLQSSRSEVLFVDYIMSHLKPSGRAGVIVPEGIIFQSGSAHKQLRKNIVEDGLYAVVSLPSGVFNPYAGVKTSILLFNNELAKQKSEILFLKIESDGYDLGAQRRPTSKDDLPIALNILKEWGTGKKVENKLASYVEKSKIAESDDYNLSGDRYHVAIDYTNAKWPMVELGEVCDIINGSTPKRSVSEYWENGTIPWFTIDDIRNQGSIIRDTNQKITEKGYQETSIKLLPKNTTLLCCTASIGVCAYTNIELTTNQQFNGLVIKKDYIHKLNPKYVFWCANNFKEELERMSGKATFGFVSVSTLKKFQIPLPPLEIQEQIVAELDGYAGVIAGSKQISQNWKPKIDIDPEWKKEKLESLVEILDSKRRPITKSDRKAGEYPYYGATGILDYVSDYIFDERLVLLGEDGAKWESGDQTAFIAEGKYWVNNHAHVLRPIKEKLIDIFLVSYLNQIDLSQYITGVTVPKLNQEKMRSIEIPLPPLDLQKQIVEKIEAERALVESSKKLIEIYEQKTKATIDKLWGE